MSFALDTNNINFPNREIW